jgi:hypothetical protein
MTTFTNPHERIEQLMQRVEALEAVLREARPAIEHWGSHDLYDRVYALLNPPESETRAAMHARIVTETADAIAASSKETKGEE